jgi:hypothetical protein
MEAVEKVIAGRLEVKKLLMSFVFSFVAAFLLVSSSLPPSGTLRLPNYDSASSLFFSSSDISTLGSVPNLAFMSGSGILNSAVGVSLGKNSLKRLTEWRSLYISAADLPSFNIATAFENEVTGYMALEAEQAVINE